MTRQLCISVTLFDPLFHGKRDGGEPEWPPSPMRLFQALLAGSRTGCRNGRWSNTDSDPFYAAFCWLERCNAPQIVTPDARPAAAYTLFVPNNDSDKKFDRQDRLTSKVARPHRLTTREPEQQALHYLWPIPEERWASVRPHAELLCREARHLIALGWGIDQAFGDGRVLTDAEATALSGRRWRPWYNHRPGQSLSRVPAQGSLDDLEEVHRSFLERVSGPVYNPAVTVSQFGSVMYLSAVTLLPRSYAVFEFPMGVAFRQERVNEVAAMLRSLSCDKQMYRNQQDFREQFPNDDSEVYLAGHVDPRIRSTPARFSFLPLPTIGHDHADGMVRRLLIAEPYDGKGLHARWAQQRLRNQVLRDKDGNECGVLLDLWRTSSNQMVKRYVGESRSWSTVTPVILPGFDDGKHAKAEKLFLQAIEQADLPLGAVSDLTLRKAPFWPGSLHPRQYHRPQYLRHLPAWHVQIRFREPIPGPLAIGGGRHVGLGVMASTED